jgi:hypothetical protein
MQDGISCLCYMPCADADCSGGRNVAQQGYRKTVQLLHICQEFPSWKAVFKILQEIYDAILDMVTVSVILNKDV